MLRITKNDAVDDDGGSDDVDYDYEDDVDYDYEDDIDDDDDNDSTGSDNADAYIKIIDII